MSVCVLKAVPEDFAVSECLGTATGPAGAADHQYLLLTKRGYTTHQAVAAVAAHLGVEREAVAAAGLKDEDGVTEQTLSLRGAASPEQLADFNRAHAGTDYMRLSERGHGGAPVVVGELDGNCFRIVARDLDTATADALRAGPAQHNMFFVNYYDTQRFGVPGGPKQTHLLGGALIDGDDRAAFRLLRESGSPEGGQALAHDGDPAEFLAALDPRVLAFYRCAHASAEWNERLTELVADEGGADTVETDREGLRYVLPRTPAAAREVLRAAPELDCGRYRWTDGEMRYTESPRPTVVQTRVRVLGVRPDDRFPDRWACTLSFFLPSGCYATMAVTQFFQQLEMV